MFRRLQKEGYIAASPMESMEKPRVPKNQIQPFTIEQVFAMIEATRKTSHPKRNKAIVLLWLDTGMRVDELCQLRMRDLDLHGRYVTVLGKGQKTRRIPVSAETTRAILQHLNEDGERGLHEPLFRSERGTQIGGHLTPSGARRLGQRAGPDAVVRCSPHTLRHPFAVMFLRNGGNVFTLKELLGHTSLAICQRYVSLALADTSTNTGKTHQFSRSAKGKDKFVLCL